MSLLNKIKAKCFKSRFSLVSADMRITPDFSYFFTSLLSLSLFASLSLISRRVTEIIKSPTLDFNSVMTWCKTQTRIDYVNNCWKPNRQLHPCETWFRKLHIELNAIPPQTSSDQWDEPYCGHQSWSFIILAYTVIHLLPTWPLLTHYDGHSLLGYDSDERHCCPCFFNILSVKLHVRDVQANGTNRERSIALLTVESRHGALWWIRFKLSS